MGIVIFLLACALLAGLFWGIGQGIGTYIGKKQHKRDEVAKHGNKHV